MHSCRTARPSRSSLPAAPSSGCACRASIPPACSGRCSIADAGTFRLGPDGSTVPAARRYLPGTMVLETSWGTGKGWIIVRDVLLIGNWHHQNDRSHTHRRAPTDYDADHVLLRTVRCVNGEVQLLLDCEPEVRLRARAGPRGSTTATAITRAWPGAPTASRRAQTDDRPDARVRGLTRDGPAPDEGGRSSCTARCRGQSTRRPRTSTEAYDRLVWTAHHWQHWLDRGDFPDHPWRTFLQRSAR